MKSYRDLEKSILKASQSCHSRCRCSTRVWTAANMFESLQCIWKWVMIGKSSNRLQTEKSFWLTRC